MRILLLGATGNLGCRCIPALLAHKHTVIVYVRNPSKLRSLVSAQLLDSLTIVEGDATDQIGIQNALLEYDVEGIINVAGTQVKRGEKWVLDRIANAVCDAAVTVCEQRGRILRVWITCGMGVLEYPGSGGLIEDFMPKRLSEQHRATCDIVENIPVEKVQWSLLCVAFMVPEDPKRKSVELLDEPNHHGLLLKAGAPPAFESSWLACIPWVGLWLDFWIWVLWSYTTKYEDVADFLAEDLGSGNGEWVGKKVGMKDRMKVKDV